MGKVKAILGERSVEGLKEMCEVILNMPEDEEELTSKEIEMHHETYHIWLLNEGYDYCEKVVKDEFNNHIPESRFDEYDKMVLDKFNDWVKLMAE